MRDILRKIGSFLEAHVEKIVLIIVGLVCIWLLITRVLFSPNVMPYENGMYSPGGIDQVIWKQADTLREGLGQPPVPKEQYTPQVDEFLAMIDSAMGNVNTSVHPPLPQLSSDNVVFGRAYRLPTIGDITDAKVEHIRAVAYVPTEELRPDLTYEKAGNEPNDTDLVTVEAKLDVAGLCRRFDESFLTNVGKEEWADPCLASPIFAAVHLQRQELTEDGGWGEWVDVPRSKVEHLGRLFDIVEDIEDLPPGGIKVRLLQFKNEQVQIELLQPKGYQIASTKEEWFPPTLHQEFLDQQRRDDAEEKRAARDKEREQDQRDRASLRGRMPGAGLGAGRLGPGRVGGGAYTDAYGDMGAGYGDARGLRSRQGRNVNRRDSRTARGPYADTGVYGDRGRLTGRGSRGQRTDDGGYLRDVVRRPSIADVYSKFDDEVSIISTKEFPKMKEPLLFWAHDDSVEPFNTYRYRIRVGVFNPVAGTSQLADADKALKNKVIMWSEFSGITDAVEIPGRMYFFPNEIQETAKQVTVQVSKLRLGQWHTENFPVMPGEVVGRVVETELTREERAARRRQLALRFSSTTSDNITKPDQIDYGTGAVLVDAVRVDDWAGAGSLRPRSYYDMLYSYDGASIKHMPIGSKNWPAKLAAMYAQIRRTQNVEPEEFRAFNSRVGGRRRAAPGMEGYEEMDMEYEMMMEEMMMGAGGRRP
ncbi:MAG: hypothetical protein JSU70_07695 [Phycisphaerales bacterium]|nr:MAG: hypothetical protein JSU70_07695 [Phycisphaerales bacterium]